MVKFHIEYWITRICKPSSKRVATNDMHSTGSHGEQKIDSLFQSFIMRQKGGECLIHSSKKLDKRLLEQPLKKSGSMGWWTGGQL